MNAELAVVHPLAIDEFLSIVQIPLLLKMRCLNVSVVVWDSDTDTQWRSKTGALLVESRLISVTTKMFLRILPVTSFVVIGQF